ncbi:MAG: hypothetical protein JRI23_28680 [Deltaproteobacteria bacterium]|nr:hypothetical protein [Deltaproteobacteria bacterium]MBW2536085.1 hypothetical protein [Deltaproteobacteria bacterium]
MSREIEAAGFPTVTISPIWSFTASVGAPRVIAVEHPTGRTMGMPGDGDTQREVLRAALDHLASATTPGQVRHLPLEWPEPRGKAMRFGHEPPPIVKLIKRKPWLFLKFLSGKIPEHHAR